MSAHPPPVPPAQQPKHGGSPAKADVSDKEGHKAGSPDGNLREQGQTGNTRQNTTNKVQQGG